MKQNKGRWWKKLKIKTNNENEKGKKTGKMKKDKWQIKKLKTKNMKTQKNKKWEPRKK